MLEREEGATHRNYDLSLRVVHSKHVTVILNIQTILTLHVYISTSRTIDITSKECPTRVCASEFWLKHRLTHSLQDSLEAPCVEIYPKTW